MKQVYFACSITGGREDEAVYRAIVEALLQAGYRVPTAHLAHPETLHHEALTPAEEIYTRDMAWLQASDALIAEVSTPSHGVGYEIATAVHLGKPVLTLAREGVRVSKMLVGNPHIEHRTYRETNQAAQEALAFLRRRVTP